MALDSWLGFAYAVLRLLASAVAAQALVVVHAMRRTIEADIVEDWMCRNEGCNGLKSSPTMTCKHRGSCHLAKALLTWGGQSAVFVKLYTPNNRAYLKRSESVATRFMSFGVTEYMPDRPHSFLAGRRV